MRVTQGFNCGVCAMGVNLFKHQIGPFIANATGSVANYLYQLLYVWDYVVSPEITFLSVGTSPMIDAIFGNIIWHRYCYSD